MISDGLGEADTQEDEHENEAEDETPQRSTKRPLGKRKRGAVPSKAELVMEEAVSILKTTANPKQPVDDEEIFGRNIACGLRKIKDERSKEFAKVKMQEIIFQAQFGLLSAGAQSYPQNRFISHNVPQQSHNWMERLHSPISPSPSVYGQVQHTPPPPNFLP